LIIPHRKNTSLNKDHLTNLREFIMNGVIYHTIYALVFFSTLPLPSLSQENLNQLPGLLKFANDYEEKKQGMEDN
ncbi:hypothetical protein, partial [Providencia stuartii]|uniref:hypothetical protein n=1 Tax=Providencia stuartii TaxID=588 RepID=UPI001C5CA779